MMSLIQLLRTIIWALVVFTGLAITACERPSRGHDVHFTKADSVTETYLALHDSVVQVWNLLVREDNKKLSALKNIVHELKVSKAADAPVIASYEDQLRSLRNSRFTQKSMSNPNVIEEYDLASKGLVAELTDFTESQRQYAYNSTLQKLVKEIRNAERQSSIHRARYDAVAARYNEFIERNKELLKESSPEEKPLFSMTDR